MKKTLLVISMCMMLSLTACGIDKNNETQENSSTASQITAETNEIQEEAAEGVETLAPTDITEESQTQTLESFELTDKGNAFLISMCRDLIDFDSQALENDAFWCDFLLYFYTYSPYEDLEAKPIYRESLNSNEFVFKISLLEAETTTKLIFGLELPDIKPSFENMSDEQLCFFYQDGYYYIGFSEPPVLKYTLTYCKASDGYVTVKYRLDGPGDYNFGAITFTIVPEDNENGFIITSKKTDIFI